MLQKQDPVGAFKRSCPKFREDTGEKSAVECKIWKITNRLPDDLKEMTLYRRLSRESTESFRTTFSKIAFGVLLLVFQLLKQLDFEFLIRILFDSIFQIENYTVLHQVRKSSRGGGLSIFVHKEVYFTSLTYLSLNSDDVEPLCIELNYKK